jgi:hypothetical protein
MKIQDVLKETEKAINKHNPCNGITGYVAWHEGELCWFGKSNDLKRCALTHEEIFEDYEPYHPVGQIAPEEVGELWTSPNGTFWHTEEDEEGDLILVGIGIGDGTPKSNKISEYDGNFQHWTRVSPSPVKEDVEEIVIEGVRWYEDGDGDMMPSAEKQSLPRDLPNKPKMTMKLSWPKEK